MVRLVWGSRSFPRNDEAGHKELTLVQVTGAVTELPFQGISPQDLVFCEELVTLR